VKVKASIINTILKKYGYKFVFDKIHADTELKKYKKYEPNFDTHKYLTIKTTNNIVVGRIYTHNTSKSISLTKIELNEEEINKILAFFKFFRIKNYEKILKEINKVTGINPKELHSDIIRNNVYQRRKNIY